MYVRGSHCRELVEARIAGLADATALLGGEGYGADALVESVFPHRETWIAPAGTALLADTFGFHKGIPPQTKHRLMFWARYGLHAAGPDAKRMPRASLLSRVSDDEMTRYISHGVFR